MYTIDTKYSMYKRGESCVIGKINNHKNVFGALCN